MSDPFPPATHYGNAPRGASLKTAHWIAILVATVVIAVVLALLVTRSDDNKAGSGSLAAQSAGSTNGAKAQAAKGQAPAGSGKVINGSGGQGTKNTQPSDSTTPTDTSTPTDTATPTSTDSSPTNSPSGTHTRLFPPRTNFTNIVIGPIQQRLDDAASASYGEANVSAGFSPDPYSVGMTTGGQVDVSYLGSSCSGFATSAPNLRINFGGGGASLLRLYFVGSTGDPTMVINDPYGNFYCVDNSFGTVDPAIDFNHPAGGAYDVWICSNASGATVSGTTYLTENSGNHP